MAEVMRVSPSKTPEARRAYRERMREHRRAYNREWWQKNKAAKQLRNHAWRRENAEKIADYTRKYHVARPWISMFGTARKRAKQRGLEFSLSHEWARDRWTGRCELSGIELQPGAGGQCMRSPTIDRIDSTKGYTPDNCRFVCLALNAMRGDGTDVEMLAILKAAVAHMEARG